MIYFDNTTNQMNFTLPSGLTATPPAKLLVMNMNEYANNGEVEVIYGTQISPPSETGCDGDWGCRGYGAATCALEPCVRGYNAVVSGGKFQQTMTQSVADWGFSTDTLIQGMVDLACTNASEKMALQSQGYDVDNATRWLAFNITTAILPAPTSQFVLSNESSSIRPQCLYGASVFYTMSIHGFLAEIFDQQLAINTGSEGGSSLLEIMYNDGNISFHNINDVINNISVSLTNYMRDNGNANYSNPTIGLLSREGTCVHVRWAWLTFQIVLSVFALIFFVVMLIETSSVDHDFKCSVLPLMVAGVPELSPQIHGGSKSPMAQVEREAKGILVRFRAAEGGWKFERVEKEVHCE